MKEEATFLTVKNKSSQQEFKINTEDILYAMKTEEESHAKPWIYMIDGKQFYYSNSIGVLEEQLGKAFYSYQPPVYRSIQSHSFCNEGIHSFKYRRETSL